MVNLVPGWLNFIHASECDICTMVFSTPEFLFLFLPPVWLVFCLLSLYARQSLLSAWLGLTSLVFYGMWDVTLLPLLLLSIFINYWLAGHVWKSRTWLWLGVTFNLGLLAWFKYSVFFLTAVDFPAAWFGPLALPLGISFFTFQQIAFLVDVRQRKTEKDPLSTYAVFVSFFPQLIAGPIVHHRSLAPQLSNLALPEARLVCCGLMLLALGLAKKLLIADNIAPLVDQVYSKPSATLVAGDTIIAGWGYGLQLYFDFSGYADMAVGLALMFGIRLPQNFDSPYRAVSIREFWRRWHITLSGFLRDYLYIPLGGSRRGLPRHLAAIMLTMLLGGLWHGAGWQFVLWGGFHGVLLVWQVCWRRLFAFRLPLVAGWGLTFCAVMLAWVPFRARSLEQTWSIYSGLTHWQWGALTDIRSVFQEGIMAVSSPGLLIMFATLIVTVMPNSTACVNLLDRKGRYFWQGAVTGGILLMALKAMMDLPSQAFLYFNF